MTKRNLKQFCIALAFIGLSAGAAKAQNVGDAVVATNDDGIEITYEITSVNPNEVQVGRGENIIPPSTSGALIIPSQVTGGTGNLTYAVTSIRENAFLFLGGGLTSVTIPNSVRTIGNFAFQNCSNLVSVTIGNSVESIGGCAFWGCSSLISVIIPNLVTSIGDRTFKNCSSLTSVTVGNSVESINGYAFEGCGSIATLNYNAVNCNNCRAFSGLTSLTTLNIGDNVETIPGGFMVGCTGLTSLTFGRSVTSIGNNAFNGCTGLTGTLIIPDLVQIIELEAFQECTGLSSVTIGNSVESIGDHAFSDCNGLTSVFIPNSVTSIGGGAFASCGLTAVTIPSGVTLIGNGAFAFCPITTINYNAVNCSSSYALSWLDLTTLNIGNDVETIPDYALWNCTDLTSIAIPASVTTIGEHAFSGCTGLTSIYIPNTVTSMGTFSFENCSNLSAVTLPDWITAIPDNAFKNCTALSSFNIGSNITEIGEYAFYGTGLTSIAIPEAITLIYANAFGSCNSLVTVNFNAANCTQMGVQYWDYNLLPVFPDCPALTALNIGANVEAIPDYAFWNCTGLTSIAIPGNVTTIGEHAFNGCTGLTSLHIPNTVTSMGNWSFENCSNLSAVTLPDWITAIPDNAFKNCTALSSFNIGGNVTTIGNSAFNGTALTSVTIPEAITSIGGRAFTNCSSLTTVNFNATSCTQMGEQQGSTYYLAFNMDSTITTVNIGANVQQIPAFAFPQTGITSVNIPNSVTSIGQQAFYGCPISSLTLGNQVATIGTWAFYNTAITTLTIPNSITTIGGNAFAGCTALETLNYNAANCNYAFQNLTALTTLNVGNDVEIIPNDFVDGCTALETLNYNAANCNYTFQNLTALTTLNLGDNVETIPDNFVKGCTGLTSVTIPGGVTTIGGNAFGSCSSLATVNFNAANCTKMGINDDWMGGTVPVFSDCPALTTLNIGENVEAIPTYAFWGCSNLTTLTIPNSVTTIGGSAFGSCSSLATVNFNAANCTQMGQWPWDGHFYYYIVFSNCPALTTLNIGENVEVIPIYAFADCSNLTTLTIPNSVTTIGANAFGSCSNLATVNFNATNCTQMGMSEWSWEDPIPVFTDCNALTTLNIGANVETIPNNAFVGCSGLLSVAIPHSVTSIGESAFADCSSLASLSLGNSLATIGHSAFNGTALTSVTIPEAVTSIGGKAFTNCSSLATVNFNATNCTSMGILQGNIIYTAFHTDSTITTVNIGANVQQIPAFAFPQTAITTLTIPNSVTTVEQTAFYNCPISSLTLGNQIATIGEYAFYNAAIPSLVIPNSVTSIGNYAFGNCFALTQLTLGSGIVSIGAEAFSESPLDTLVSLAVTPPVLGSPVVFSYDDASGHHGMDQDAPIFVPCGSAAAYNSAPHWNYYTNIHTEGSQPTTLCMISVDNNSHNEVVWKTGAEVASYNIYREGNVSGQYELAANVPYGEASSWTDAASNAKIRSYRYKVSTVGADNCESLLSSQHRTMHLTINQGQGNTWNLIWTEYEGLSFSTYNIYRGTSPAFSDMTLIGTMPSQNTTYSDFTAPAGYVYYIVEIEMGTGCETSKAVTSIHSNVATNNAAAIEVFHVTVTADPAAMGTVSGGGDYVQGSTATIGATPYQGYRFLQWHDGNAANPRTITVTKDTAFTAIFEALIHVAVVTGDSAMGTVSGGGDYVQGSTATLSATPNAGYRFLQWHDGNTANPRTITVTQDTTFTAVFGIEDGIADREIAAISVYPNPSSDELFISAEVPILSVEVCDMTGRAPSLRGAAIARYEATATKQSQSAQVIQVSHLPTGIYLLKIHTEQGVVTRKFVKQ